MIEKMQDQESQQAERRGRNSEKEKQGKGEGGIEGEEKRKRERGQGTVGESQRQILESLGVARLGPADAKRASFAYRLHLFHFKLLLFKTAHKVRS